MDPRLERIRENEERSHTKIYSSEKLYDSGSWLNKPVKTVRDILPLLASYDELHVLDLGCGVGRNSIFIAESFIGKKCEIDCVDLLQIAVDKLNENAVQHGVADKINGIVVPIEKYSIKEDDYDLIIAVSALEHIDTKANFCAKLTEIRKGIRKGGMVCLIINSEVSETDTGSGKELEPQFEVNLSSEELHSILEREFPGWEVLKQSVSEQIYDIPRDDITSRLSTKVVSFVAKR